MEMVVRDTKDNQMVGRRLYRPRNDRCSISVDFKRQGRELLVTVLYTIASLKLDFSQCIIRFHDLQSAWSTDLRNLMSESLLLLSLLVVLGLPFLSHCPVVIDPMSKQEHPVDSVCVVDLLA